MYFYIQSLFIRYILYYAFILLETLLLQFNTEIKPYKHT